MVSEYPGEALRCQRAREVLEFASLGPLSSRLGKEVFCKSYLRAQSSLSGGVFAQCSISFFTL